MLSIHVDTSSWCWQLFIHVNSERHESQTFTSNIFSCHTVAIIFATAALASETIRGGQGRRAVGDTCWDAQDHGGTWFYLETTIRRHKGNRKNRDRTPPQRNTHDWRQMTSETDAGTRQVVRHTKADRRKSRTPPLWQTNDWRLNDGETEKLGDTWRDNWKHRKHTRRAKLGTQGRRDTRKPSNTSQTGRHMKRNEKRTTSSKNTTEKVKERHPTSQAPPADWDTETCEDRRPPARHGDKWRRTSEDRDPESRTPPAS